MPKKVIGSYGNICYHYVDFFFSSIGSIQWPHITKLLKVCQNLMEYWMHRSFSLKSESTNSHLNVSDQWTTGSIKKNLHFFHPYTLNAVKLRNSTVLSLKTHMVHFLSLIMFVFLKMYDQQVRLKGKLLMYECSLQKRLIGAYLLEIHKSQKKRTKNEKPL